MKTKILVAGSTGKLGGMIVHELIQKGAEVHALVRTGASIEKIDALKKVGAIVVEVDMSDASALTEACTGMHCVVSALQGIDDVIVDLQTNLLEAALTAKVRRFIPSDFASDFTKQPEGENRNFDLRREFKKRLDESAIAATSILNGAFAEVLYYGTPLLDFKNKTVSYWGDRDWKIDFTTMDNVAAYTACVALDTQTPRILRITSFRPSPADLARVAEEIMREPFELVSRGTIADLAEYNTRERAAHPEGEQELYPEWQRSQYVQSMLTVQHESLDTSRYPEVVWTSLEDFLAHRPTW